MNSYKQMNTELNNYKELYLKEKQKSNLYKEKYESLIKNPEESNRINNINNNKKKIKQVKRKIKGEGMIKEKKGKIKNMEY